HLLTLWVCKLLMLICILTKNVITSCSVTMMLFLHLEVKPLMTLTTVLYLSCSLISGHLAMMLMDMTKLRRASFLDVFNSPINILSCVSLFLNLALCLLLRLFVFRLLRLKRFSTLTLKVLNLFSRSRRKTNKQIGRAVQQNAETDIVCRLLLEKKLNMQYCD